MFFNEMLFDNTSYSVFCEISERLAYPAWHEISACLQTLDR